MVVVSVVFNVHDLPEHARGFARDTLTLGWEERVFVRGRRRTDGGVEIGTALPRGTVLRDGDCFVVDDLALVIAVVERCEPVFVIAPASAPAWALYAYHIGNRHQPVMVTERGLVCPDVPGVEPLLQQHRMPYERAMLPFTPVATTLGHRHG